MGDREWAGSARSGGDADAIFHRAVVDIAIHFPFMKRYTGIDDDRVIADHVSRENMFFADTGYDDIGGEALLANVSRRAIADGDGSSTIHHHDSQRFPDERTGSEDGDIPSGEVGDTSMFEECEDAGWGRWEEIVRLVYDLAEVPLS